MMILSDLIAETATALTANKVRSGLTMLGIIIGIASVIALTAIGQGAQGQIESNIQSLGSNLVQVYPGVARGAGTQISGGRGSASTLTEDDASVIGAAVASVLAVAPEVSGRYQVTVAGTNTNTTVIGTTAAYAQVRSIAVSDGAFISASQEQSGARVAVLGPTVRDDLFGEGADVVGQMVRIKGSQFKVIGVMDTKGGTGFSNQDDRIIVPLLASRRYLSGGTSVSAINIQAADSSAMETVQSEVTALLLERHRISDPALSDFSVLNQADIVSAASSVTSTFTMLLGSIAGISLIVGGIGIMNMMLTAVTERTREIGLRKAIGARRGDISTQFLVEAIVLTSGGGVAGIVLGFLVAWIISAAANLPTVVSIGSVVLAVSVSAGIGVAFGWYPARRAARLHPIEALRHE